MKPLEEIIKENKEADKPSEKLTEKEIFDTIRKESDGWKLIRIKKAIDKQLKLLNDGLSVLFE